MDSLLHRHLTTLTLDVDFAGVVPIGATPAGHRGIAPVRGGRFEGDRLRGDAMAGHDWFVTRGDGVLVIDVRLTLKTDDGATVYLAYAGRMVGQGDAMARFRKGEKLAAEDYSLTIMAKFECGDPRYAWLNDAIVVGTGAQTPTGPVYTLFEVGA
jgi:hypothetical protein